VGHDGAVVADVAGVVLAAGAGRRLAPITDVAPKALCPVGGRPLVDHALDRLGPFGAAAAVNAHHGADRLVAHLGDRAHVSVEAGVARGTAGALGVLAPWVDGRDVLVTNADAWFAGPIDLAGFVAGWDRVNSRLLCIETGRAADFGTLRYCGVALLPAGVVAALPTEPAGLYEVAWRAAAAAGRLDLVVHDGVVVDCGTPADYLRANLLATGGASQVAGARIGDGATVTRSVVWSGSSVAPGEVLVDAVRAGPVTVFVR
jgi:NDP-sugar pyrophosphorylase family protein